MAFFRRSTTVLVLILSALSIYVGLLNLLDRMQWREPSDGVNWTQTPRGVEVKSLEAPRLIATRSGLGSGDRLLSINGMPIRNLDDYTEVVELLAGTLPPGTQATYLLEKAGSGSRLSYPIEIQLQPRTSFTDFLLALVAFTHLGIGLLIFLRSWKAQGAFHFYLICLVAFVLYLYRYSGRADTFDLLIYWSSATAFVLLPPLFVHFCCYFPQPLSLVRNWPSLRFLFYLPSLFLLGFQALWFSGSLKPLGLPRTAGIEHFLDKVHLSHFMTFFLLGTLALVYSRRQAPSPIQRLQMKWVTRGTLIAILPFLCLYAVPFLIGLPISPYMEASILGLVLIPLSFGYAITKHRLMDVALIFKQGAAYVLASSALLGLYVVIVLSIGRVIQGFSPESGFVLFALSALLVAFLFAPLKNKIQDQIDRYFYREEYDYRQSLADFGKTLRSEIGLSSLTERISTRLRKTLNVAPIALFLRDDAQGDLYRLFHAQHLPVGTSKTTELVIPDTIFSDFDRELNPLFLLPPSEVVDRVRAQLSEWDLHYVQPLRVRGRVIGFLGLGKRFDGQFLSSEDLDLIGTLARYAAIAIDNALLYRSLETKANELAQLKAYSENVVESITVGVLVITPEGEITVWNDSMQTICGLRADEVLGKNISEVFPVDLVRTLQKIVEGPPWIVQETSRLYKTHIQSTDGHSRLVNITVSPFLLQDDVVTGTLLVLDDITEKVQLESQLLQAEKLSSIGLLAAGIAHEVNTPLTAISSYSQMLLKEIPADDPRHKMLKKIERQGFRASNIVNNLLNFARVKDSDFHEINVNSLMLETLSLLDHQFRKAGLDVKLDLDPTMPPTLANGSKLQQVFMNLCLNAKDAMPQGGQLSVKTYRTDSLLVVEIQDSGVGISEQDVKRIYDPFFTTKDIGRGTGLGLSVSYGIIQELSGRISVESKRGKGTTFRLHLPIKRVN
ncbi:ATP-binding protein [Acidobacteria bacterium AH-259-O06]|nr:ATP-binding protein [Acidobacteria bacterium AH-259-O06]